MHCKKDNLLDILLIASKLEWVNDDLRWALATSADNRANLSDDSRIGLQSKRWPLTKHPLFRPALFANSLQIRLRAIINCK
jgi:hypothetical protein